MKLSELIAKLEKLKVEHSDLPVHVYDDWDDFPIGCVYYENGLEIDGTTRLRPEHIIINSDQQWTCDDD